VSTPQAARFDAVVVGAGPAGSIAALVLARGGARVALADKAAFPRDKACGDLIGPRGVQVLDDLGLTVPDAGHGSDLLAVGPSGRRSRLPAFTGRSYPGHGIVVPRVAFDHALREAALDAGAVGVRARVAAVEQDPDGTVRAVLASDGQRLAGDVIIGADGALSTVARLAGMLDSESALWGFAVRAYVPGEVPLPLLVLLESAPWRIYPGYGWLFPGADGQANVGIGIGMGGTRHSAPLRDDLDRFTALLRSRGDLRPAAEPGPVVGGWLRMGGTGTPPAVANVLLAGDAAGLINPLQGEGIAPAMISARLAAEAVLADPCRAGPAYTRALHQTFGRYMTGASALQRALLRRPWAASASMRLVTAPGVRHLVASTWSIYWNGLADGARPRPAAWAARGVETAAARLARSGPGHRDPLALPGHRDPASTKAP
jgi:geranylgeranyl reductase family protein